jgi:hypothetical protein
MKSEKVKDDGRSIKTSRELESIRTKWYAFDKRDPLLTARVAGMNFQSKPQKVLFFTRETQTTLFFLEISVINSKYTWQVQKTFDELREFYLHLINDPMILRGKDLLKVPTCWLSPSPSQTRFYCQCPCCRLAFPVEKMEKWIRWSSSNAANTLSTF